MNFVNVLDTSVLLSAGKNALYSFPDSEVVIPLIVVEELEKKRNDPELGKAARSVLVELDRLRLKGNLREGVGIDKGASVKIEINHQKDVPADLVGRYSNDVKIITVAHGLAKDPAYAGAKIILVSKDLPMKILASLVGVYAIDFTPKNVESDYIDAIGRVPVSDEEMRELSEFGLIRLNVDVPRNAGVLFENKKTGATKLVIARAGYKFEEVKNASITGIESRSAEQALAIDYLMDDSVRLVSLGGRAGTGKTTLALAAGLEQVADHRTSYKKLTVFRSMQAVGGEELGALPGTLEEKVDPWIAAIYDSLESLNVPGQKIDLYKKNNMIELLPLTHIRGRSMDKRFMLIDEAQNLEKSTIMTAISRAGRNTKVVMSWDVSQRDNLHVGRYDGVYEVVSRLMGERLFAHVSLQKSERSDLAELVSRKLDDFEL